MKPWKRVEPTKVTKVGWRTITSKTFVMPDDTKMVFDTLHGDGQKFANVIALTPDKKVIVAKQYRPGPEKMMYELPGGFVDKGEKPEDSAIRELLEETGYEAGRVVYLGEFHKDTFMNASWHTVIAYDCKKIHEQKLESEEFIDIEELPIDEFIAHAKNDEMTDHASVLLAYDELTELKEES